MPGSISSSLPGRPASTGLQQHITALAVGSPQEALPGCTTAEGSAGLLSSAPILGQKGLPGLAGGGDTALGSTLPQRPPKLRFPPA